MVSFTLSYVSISTLEPEAVHKELHFSRDICDLVKKNYVQCMKDGLVLIGDFKGATQDQGSGEEAFQTDTYSDHTYSNECNHF